LNSPCGWNPVTMLFPKMNCPVQCASVRRPNQLMSCIPAPATINFLLASCYDS
jgi:hypothetical protein